MPQIGFASFDEVGSLRDKNDSKILICYLMNEINGPVPKSLLDLTMQSHAIVNYFDFNEALQDMLRTGHLSSCITENEVIYEITETGRVTGRELYKNIPFSIREKALTTLQDLLKEYQAEKNNMVSIEKTEKGIRVHCRILDREEELFSFSVFVPNMSQADFIKKQFLKNPSKIYSSLFSVITDNFDYYIPDEKK